MIGATAEAAAAAQQKVPYSVFYHAIHGQLLYQAGRYADAAAMARRQKGAEALMKATKLLKAYGSSHS